jgi:hypothetical protein
MKLNKFIIVSFVLHAWHWEVIVISSPVSMEKWLANHNTQH